ncbi:hypothetical protein J1P26_17360 [Neobacillus sp. MM2021_6]|uniref:BC1872 family protein n=1 Tax=Bacillaceae TaxID=186817 RepID=UPI0014072560|nr:MULTISPECIES: hypothetical protein [Bacillaceae]MBO0961477.1 hypothetical protein [Neobacillus sp. MM2021_6]NHC19581.1 hypothetical protein [Bacillus sp. MM2020_4]
MNGHVLYTKEDFKDMSWEEWEGNRTAELVLDGGLNICKICGEYEAGLDNPCRPQKRVNKLDNREIDKLIAEKIFGWQWFTRTNANSYWLGAPEEINLEPDKYTGKVILLSDEERTWKESEWFMDDIPQYFSKIEDAWLVVEKLSKNSDFILSKDCDDSFFICEFHFTLNEVYIETAETAPLAICKAALKAVGVEV